MLIRLIGLIDDHVDVDHENGVDADHENCVDADHDIEVGDSIGADADADQAHWVDHVNHVDADQADWIN